MCSPLSVPPVHRKKKSQSENNNYNKAPLLNGTFVERARRAKREKKSLCNSSLISRVSAMNEAAASRTKSINEADTEKSIHTLMLIVVFGEQRAKMKAKRNFYFSQKEIFQFRLLRRAVQSQKSWQAERNLLVVFFIAKASERDCVEKFDKSSLLIVCEFRKEDRLLTIYTTQPQELHIGL